VAAINGAVTGAGTQLALVCDVRLAASSARFIYREGRLGIIPSHGGVTRLVKLIGLARARDVLLGGEELSAEQAHATGMVTEVVAEAGDREGAQRGVERIQDRHGSGRVITLHMVLETFDRSASHGLRF
jgi:enoyl-CoA hydratase/carnithine racemase